MKATEQTIQKAERFIKKVAEKFPASEEPTIMTDIHIQASQDSGELLAFDDNDNEITRCIIEQWIGNSDDSFYDDVTAMLRKALEQARTKVDSMGIIKPFNFTLENDDKETVAELYVADDDTVIIGGDIMSDLDEDLNFFFEKLMK